MSKALHLMVTSLCDRNCKYCCNKQYDLNDIPYVEDEELRKTERVYITGGEPFKYSNPSKIAGRLKKLYPNIKRVVVYTNAMELAGALHDYESRCLYFIDGLTISIKHGVDKFFFETELSKDERILGLHFNAVYVFPGYEDTQCPNDFVKVYRTWQANFIPAPNSIFRKI